MQHVICNTDIESLFGILGLSVVEAYDKLKYLCSSMVDWV